MFKAAVILSKKDYPGSKKFFELTAKTALDNNDIDFAWKAAMYVGKLK